MAEVYVGKDLGGHDYEVTEERIARYRAGTRDREAYDGIAPAMLFHSECFTFLADWYLPNIVGNLHAKQEWEFFREMRAGGRVRTRAFVAERYRKRNRDYVVCETLTVDDQGALLNRGRTHQSFLVEDAGGLVVDRDREKSGARRFAIGEGEGRKLSGEPKRIDLEMCRAFSGPSENYHTNREAAQALGFPDVVVQGMMSLCFVSELLTRELGPGWQRGGKMTVSLVNVVWAEDLVTARAAAQSEVPEGAGFRRHYDVWCEKADGTKAVVGTASGFVSANLS